MAGAASLFDLMVSEAGAVSARDRTGFDSTTGCRVGDGSRILKGLCIAGSVGDSSGQLSIEGSVGVASAGGACLYWCCFALVGARLGCSALIPGFWGLRVSKPPTRSPVSTLDCNGSGFKGEESSILLAALPMGLGSLPLLLSVR